MPAEISNGNMFHAECFLSAYWWRNHFCIVPTAIHPSICSPRLLYVCMFRTRLFPLHMKKGQRVSFFYFYTQNCVFVSKLFSQTGVLKMGGILSIMVNALFSVLPTLLTLTWSVGQTHCNLTVSVICVFVIHGHQRQAL